MFDKYLEDSVTGRDKLYHNYLGITKKEFPKWQGWKIIASYKDRGIDVKLISDKSLDARVRNFYYVKYLSERF